MLSSVTPPRMQGSVVSMTIASTDLKCWADALLDKDFSLPCLPQNSTCTRKRPFSALEFFKDTPWFNVPQDRLGHIVIESIHPRGKLLGGSGKPSKLAALAAARRKAAQEDKAKSGAAASSDSSDAARQTADTTADTTAKLDALHICSQPDASGSSTRSVPQQPASISSPPASQSAPKPSQQHKDPMAASRSESEAGSVIRSLNMGDIKAVPSAFAKTMLGEDQGRMTEDNIGSRRYLNSLPSTDNDPFAGPSPDDVVLKAQAKGSTR